MSKQEFIEQYTEVFARWMLHDSGSIAAKVYAKKMIEMYNAHPEWAEEAEALGDDPIDMSAS